jgi:hypothetical protein
MTAHEVAGVVPGGWRTELLLGVGFKDVWRGALINGTYKFIASGGNTPAADYW